MATTGQMGLDRSFRVWDGTGVRLPITTGGETLKIRVITAALALAALAIVPAANAGAATQTEHPVWNYVWKPGTALPKIGPNKVLDAWPVQSVMGTLKVGHAVPMVTMGHTTAKGTFVRTASRAAVRKVTNYGVVDLLADPDSCDEPQLNKNLGKKWTTIGTSFSLIRPVTQLFTYSRDQSSSLEVGLSSIGPDGSWSGDGTESISDGSNGSQSFPKYHRGSERYATYFRYGRFVQICGGRFSSATYWYIMADEWGGRCENSAPEARAVLQEEQLRPRACGSSI